MNEYYQKVDDELRFVVKMLNLILDNDGEDVTCYYSNALDDYIQRLIKASRYMALAESKE